MTHAIVVVKGDHVSPLWRKLWMGWIGAFFLFEGWALKNKTKGDTLSEHTRDYFKTKGPVGSFVFLGAFGTFAAWFAAHIAGRSPFANSDF